MISALRSVIAYVLAGVIWLFTLGRVRVDETGRSTGAEDAHGTTRPAAVRELDDDELPPER